MRSASVLPATQRDKPTEGSAGAWQSARVSAESNSSTDIEWTGTAADMSVPATGCNPSASDNAPVFAASVALGIGPLSMCSLVVIPSRESLANLLRGEPGQCALECRHCAVQLTDRHAASLYGVGRDGRSARSDGDAHLRRLREGGREIPSILRLVISSASGDGELFSSK